MIIFIYNSIQHNMRIEETPPRGGEAPVGEI